MKKTHRMTGVGGIHDAELGIPIKLWVTKVTRRSEQKSAAIMNLKT